MIPYASVLTQQAGVQLFIKHEAHNHPLVSGNKWWKLKYNLVEAERQGHHTLLTFGGAYSNHIHATAAAAHTLGLHSIGIIRGEETLPLNPTLTFASSMGMTLQYVSRTAYRQKDTSEMLDALHRQFGNFYYIPEGGTNDLALRGVEEYAQIIPGDIDVVACACGTGGTLAGLIRGLPPAMHVIGFPVLKGDFMTETVQHLVQDNARANWRIVEGYHFGGYGKAPQSLIAFMHEQAQRYQLELEQVYTAKAFFGLLDLVRQGAFAAGTRLLFIHTGGMQGRQSLNSF